MFSEYYHQIYDGLHHHIANEIAQSSHAEEEPHSPSSQWLSLLTEFAGGVVGELVSDYLPGMAYLGHDHHGITGPATTSAHADYVGAPTGSGFTHQTTAFTCAVVSQKMILDQFGVVDPATGQPVSESLLVFEATSHGWLTDHGTSLDNMADLLELHGIPCHHGHDWHHLIQDLSRGHQVAIAVNSNEIWTDNPWSTFMNQIMPGHPDHAVVLKGLTVDEHGHVTVVLNDPGRPDGAGVEYPLEKFQAALGNGSFHYVATDIAPPSWESNSTVEALLRQQYELSSISQEPSESPSSLHDFSDQLSHMNDSERLEFLRNL
jgi:hypothetical protein